MKASPRPSQIRAKASRALASTLWMTPGDRSVCEIDAALKAGGDVDAHDRDGLRAIHHAIRCKRHDLVEHLLAHGARPDADDPAVPCPPLHEAIDHADVRMIGILLQAGAPVDACDRMKERAMHRIVRLACRPGATWRPAFEALRAADARIDHPGDAQTPFMFACSQHQLDCADVLLDGGAQIDRSITAASQRTALVGVVQMTLEHSLNSTARSQATMRFLLGHAADPTPVIAMGSADATQLLDGAWCAVRRDPARLSDLITGTVKAMASGHPQATAWAAERIAWLGQPTNR